MNIRHFIWLVGIAAGTTAAAQDTVSINQTTDSMKTEKKEPVAVRAYKATEKAFVEGYNAVEGAFVKGYNAVENGCVKMFAQKGETTEETKARLQAGVAKAQNISAEAQERSRTISEETQQRSREIS